MEKPKDMPSIFTKNRSKAIMVGLRFENIKKKVTNRIIMMK